MVVERDRNLDQALQELFFRSGGGSPNVLENFMGVKKVGVIEQRDSVTEIVRQHKRHFATDKTRLSLLILPHFYMKLHRRAGGDLLFSVIDFRNKYNVLKIKVL
jgi:hypothetical protein